MFMVFWGQNSSFKDYFSMIQCSLPRAIKLCVSSNVQMSKGKEGPRHLQYKFLLLPDVLNRTQLEKPNQTQNLKTNPKEQTNKKTPPT